MNYTVTKRILVLYLVLLVSSSNSGGQSFSVEGEIETLGFKPGQNSKKKKKKARFNILVDGCKWLVRVVEEGNPFDYFECGGDGREV